VGRVIVFDVIETLLDLSALDEHFERVFHDAVARQQWFVQMLQSAFVATITHAYTDFGSVGHAALDMVAARGQITLSDEQRQEILGAVRTLPPHPDVKDGLERLRSAGLRLVALTNSTAATAEAQLSHAGLRGYFDRVFSVDEVRRFKPAAEVYRMVARVLGMGEDRLRLVAAHDWDVTGALRAGLKAAFVARPGKVLNPLGDQPDIVGRDLREIAPRIIEMDLSA
jgi:2-haloacid dehalogenase